jgi:hypothetical protein
LFKCAVNSSADCTWRSLFTRRTGAVVPAFRVEADYEEPQGQRSEITTGLIRDRIPEDSNYGPTSIAIIGRATSNTRASWEMIWRWIRRMEV